MSSGFIKFVAPLLVSLVVFPFIVMAALAGLWQVIDWVSAQLWPVALNSAERNFLSGLWLGGCLLTGGMFYVAVRRHSLKYAAGGMLATVSLLLFSYLNMPLTEEAEHRWVVGHQLEQREWQQASAYSKEQFEQLISSMPGQLNQWRILTALENNKSQFPPLDYSPQDSEPITKLWTAALQSPQPDTQAETRALSKMQDAIVWMPDQAQLLLATGLFSLTTASTLELTLVSSNTISQIFQSSIQNNPQDADAWTGWALAKLLVADDVRFSRSGTPGQILQQVNNALMVAIRLEKKGKYQPMFHRRLQQFIATLPQKERRILNILQARAALLVGSAEPFDPALVELANQNLIPAVSAGGGNEPLLDDASEITSVVSFVMSNDEIRRTFGTSKDNATTLLSIDVDERGEPVSVLPFVSSGAHKFDLIAVNNAFSWRFPASNSPQHRFMPVDFINTDLTSGMYLQIMQVHISKMASLVARHDQAGIRQQSALIRWINNRVWVGKPNFGMKSEDVARLKKLLASLTMSDEYFVSSIEQLKLLVKRYNQSPDLLQLLALQQMSYYNYGLERAGPPTQAATSADPGNKWAYLLWDARLNFGRAIAMDPTRADAWYGWGLTWIDEDPEKLVGAVSYARRLAQKVERSEPTSEAGIKAKQDQLFQIVKAWVMVGESLSIQRKGWMDVLIARVGSDYQDIFYPQEGSGGNRPLYMTNEQIAQFAGLVAIRPVPFPASLEPVHPEDPLLESYSAGIVSVNFDQAGITVQTRSLPFFPDAGPQSAGVKTVVIGLDVSAQGKPQLVLISSSSGIASYDEAALAAAWRWRFEKRPTDYRQQVIVSFRR